MAALLTVFCRALDTDIVHQLFEEMWDGVRGKCKRGGPLWPASWWRPPAPVPFPLFRGSPRDPRSRPVALVAAYRRPGGYSSGVITWLYKRTGRSVLVVGSHSDFNRGHGADLHERYIEELIPGPSLGLVIHSGGRGVWRWSSSPSLGAALAIGRSSRRRDRRVAGRVALKEMQ